MLKQLAAFLIISSIAWHILAEAAVYLSFKINQDYIEKYLCIDRDKPESNCHGCCQLKKELQEQKETKSEMPDSQLKKVEIQYFPVIAENINLFPFYIPRQFQRFELASSLFELKDIFHPPKILHR